MRHKTSHRMRGFFLVVVAMAFMAGCGASTQALNQNISQVLTEQQALTETMIQATDELRDEAGILVGFYETLAGRQNLPQSTLTDLDRLAELSEQETLTNRERGELLALLLRYQWQNIQEMINQAWKGIETTIPVDLAARIF